MRILCFSPKLPCHGVGGMQLVAWNLATGLAARGHDVDVITTATVHDRRCAVPEQLADRLAVQYLPNTRPGRYSRGWWRDSAAACLRARRERPGPDVVLSVSTGAMSALPLLGPVPVVLQAHGTSIAEVRSKLRAGGVYGPLSAIRNLYWIPWDLGMLRRCQKVVAVGPMAYDALRHPLIRSVLADDKMVMIQNGIDTDQFRPRPDARPALSDRLAIPRTDKVLLWASRLHIQKGAHLALNAFAKLEAPGISFVIIGDGPERGKLERQARQLGIADRVRFVGQIDNDDMPRWLNLGDAFVFTSIRDEGLPLNILEALATDLPIVLSASLAGFLQGMPGVYAVDPSDPTAVGRAMRHAVSAPRQGRTVIERLYSRQVMIQRYEDLFLQLVASRDAFSVRSC
jgi:glycosyltransferase involved in cell wall biosynthesis